jgi:succinyl-diaminopimelate desuccinylase
MNVVGKIGDFEGYTNQARELAQALVRFPSVVPPGDYREVTSYAADVLRDVGADEVKIVGPSPEKANVLAYFRGKGGGPTLALNGHLDVVPISSSEEAEWRVDPFAGELIDGALYGRGAVDMKGQIATMIVAMKSLRDAGIRTRGDVILALTGDEEQGSDFTGAGYLVDNDLVPADYVIVGEPSGMNIVRYHKGVCWFRLVTRGKSFHAGYPEKGVNAIEHMIHLIQAIANTRLTHQPHPVLGSYSISFDTIRGGTKVNCIADYCEAEFDIRSLPDQAAEQIEQEIKQVLSSVKQQIPTLDAELITIKKRAALDYPEPYPLFDMVAEAVRFVKGRDPDFIGHIANSDAQHFRRVGIPAVWMGPGLLSQNAHTANEYITQEQLTEGIKFFAQAAVTICRV